MKTHLSPKEFGEATGVSESSVKRWIDQGAIHAVRTVGGHRRIEVVEAVRYIRQHRLAVVKPQVLGLSELHDAPMDRGDVRIAHRTLSHSLQAGLSPQTRAILLSLFLSGHSIAQIADGPIAVSMREIGELWKASKAGIYVEHRATDLCIQAIDQLRSLIPSAAPDAPLAIGGALSDDPYLTPTLLAATTLAAEGWRTMNLGPQTPPDVLMLAAAEQRPTLVWVSITSPVAERVLVEQVRSMCEALAPRGTMLVIGGQQLPRPFPFTVANLHVAYTMAELAAFARGLCPQVKSQALVPLPQ